MKKIKRNMVKRAFSRGYDIGRSGRPKEACPHNLLNQRQAWFNGWRMGWVDRIEGNRFTEPLSHYVVSSEKQLTD